MAQLPPELPPRYRPWPDPERCLLGRGGAGEVWRAQDQVLGVLVALKVWRAEGAKIKARLEREAALAARVTHPNVVGLHDVGTTPDGRPFLAFALASDGSLLDKVRNPPPWNELKGLLVGLLRALGALHSRGLLHLDVKLSNLLLHRTGAKHLDLWLADLGVARAMRNEEEEDNTLIGTVAYMPSERLSAKTHLWGPATDLFSAGAVIYRILCGKLPFPERDPTDALRARGKPPTRLPITPGYVVPPGLDEAILPMLQRNPWERYDLAADAIRAIEALPPVDDDMLATDEDIDSHELSSARVSLGLGEMGVPVWHRPTPATPPRQLPRRPHPRRVPIAPSLLVHRDVPLIGRDTELELLWRKARSVIKRRQPALVHITGPRGIGRTRLCREFTRALEESGLGEGVIVENAVREGPALGLRGAWRRIFPPHGNERVYRNEIAAVLARDRQAPQPTTLSDAELLAGWINPREGRRAADPALVRTMFVDHLVYRSWRGLSWVWFDDLHLAEDRAHAWALIDTLMTRGAPVMVIMTSRADVVSEPLLDIERRHRKSLTRIPLTPLKSSASSAFVQAHLPIEASLASKLASHTGGNPRYMRELLLHWVRLGALEPARLEETTEPVWSLNASAPPLPEDRHAFARERLSHALKRNPHWLSPLLTIAIAGRGTPERVIARVAGTTLDELVVEGLVTLLRGRPALSPPEMPEAVRQWPREEGLDTLIHEHLAAAWAEEGEDPVVLSRVGMHRAAAGLLDEALDPLDRALRALRQSLPLPDVIRLAGRTMDVAALTVTTGDPIWAHAAMVLSDSLWHLGEGEQALAQDAEIATLLLPPEEMVRAACLHAEHLGYNENANAGLERLAQVEHLIDRLEPRDQAAYFSMRAWCRSRTLDVDGGLADTDLALRSDPDNETMVRCYLNRAVLLSTRDKQAAYQAAVACIDLAHENGLLRYETLAWGLAGQYLAEVGETEELVSRLRADLSRLKARGEFRMAATALITLGEIHRADGRLDEAERAYAEAEQVAAHGPASMTPAARVNLAILGVLKRDPVRIRAAQRGFLGAERSALQRAWALLDVIATLLEGEEVDLPDPDDIAWGVRLGPDGVFLCWAMATLLDEQGLLSEANVVRGLINEAAEDHQIDVHAADDLVVRFRAPGRVPAQAPAGQ